MSAEEKGRLWSGEICVCGHSDRAHIPEGTEPCGGRRWNNKGTKDDCDCKSFRKGPNANFIVRQVGDRTFDSLLLVKPDLTVVNGAWKLKRKQDGEFAPEWDTKNQTSFEFLIFAPIGGDDYQVVLQAAQETLQRVALSRMTEEEAKKLAIDTGLVKIEDAPKQPTIESLVDRTKAVVVENVKTLTRPEVLERALIVCLPGEGGRKLLDYEGKVFNEEINNIGANTVADSLCGKDALSGTPRTSEPEDGVWVWEGVPSWWTEYDERNGDYDGGALFEGTWRRPTPTEWASYCDDEYVWRNRDEVESVEVPEDEIRENSRYTDEDDDD